MKRLRWFAPSPAMVVACLALAVALAGTSWAAVNLAPHSVGTAQLKRYSVGGLQLKNNSITSLKVRNGSLLLRDFRAGQVPRGPQGLPGPPGIQGPPGPAGPAGASASIRPGYVAEVLAQTSSGTFATTNQAYATVPNAALTVNVPSGETDKLLVQFSGQSACYGGSSLELCRLRIIVDGAELAPASGSGAVFDNNNLGEAKDGSFDAKKSGDEASRSVARISSNLSAGNHSVAVQYATSSAATAFQLGDWALIVQRVRVA